MLLALILIWYGIRFLNDMSLIAPSRAEVIAWSVADFGALSLVSAGVMWNRLKARRIFDVHAPADKLAFLYLIAWFVLCMASVVVAILRRNPADYALGDFYRYACLAWVLSLLYFSIETPADLLRLLRGIVLVYGCMTAWDLIRFNSYLSNEQGRLTTETAHQAGLIAAAVVYVLLFDRHRWARRSAAAVLVLIMVLLVRAQMLTPLITVLLAVAILLSFHGGIKVYAVSAALTLLFAGTLFYFWNTASPDSSYIMTKLLMAQDSLGPLESVEALSGVRLAEIVSIRNEVSSHPANLWLGAGVGSLVDPDPIPDPNLPVERYAEEKHYIHSGLFDVLYHCGALSMGAFLLLCFHLLRRGWRLQANGDPFGQFVIATLAVTLLMLSYDLPFESSLPLLGICFAGIGLRECPVRTQSHPVGGLCLSIATPLDCDFFRSH